jgi:hypothetical protein
MTGREKDIGYRIPDILVLDAGYLIPDGIADFGFRIEKLVFRI